MKINYFLLLLLIIIFNSLDLLAMEDLSRQGRALEEINKLVEEKKLEREEFAAELGEIQKKLEKAEKENRERKEVRRIREEEQAFKRRVKEDKRAREQEEEALQEEIRILQQEIDVLKQGEEELEEILNKEKTLKEEEKQPEQEDVIELLLADEDEPEKYESEFEQKTEPIRIKEYPETTPYYESSELGQEELRERIDRAREESEVKTTQAIACAVEEIRAHVEREKQLKDMRKQEFERLNEVQKLQEELSEIKQQEALAKKLREQLPFEENPEKIDELKNRIQEIKDLREQLTKSWGELIEEYGAVQHRSNPEQLERIRNKSIEVNQQIKLGERQQKHFEANINYLGKKKALIDLLKQLQQSLNQLSIVL